MNNLILPEQNKIRKAWHHEQWYFSVIDIVAVLTESDRPRKYWNDLKTKLIKEGSEVSEKIGQLKLTSPDGKMRETDVANIETILRLIQSIPSPKAEPLKLWLAKVGTERIAEIQNPSQGIDRARYLWKEHGRSEKWIQQRMMGQETRNKLTDYWKGHGVKEGNEYAILTNIIHQEWTELSIKDHKALKDLKKQHNLRDHMNEAELILTALAELSTRQIAESMVTEGLERNKIPAKKGGQIAKNARRELESKTGKDIISGENFLPPSNRANLL
ncbi:MAG: Bro-N domain-containing protein [Patescibacteria group bacterium]